ncbi:hypothetical protein MMC07_005177 [Pseudocyphellaria aurata]|nr:hypothetical protein [Pseudocyphellaria aurata]
MSFCSTQEDVQYDYIICGGGTAGCVVAGRLAEIPNASILVIEAGNSNDKIEGTHYAGGCWQVIGTPDDWNITNEPHQSINNREIKLSRGKFLGGSSGVNGTLCVRGVKEDFDEWGIPGWTGEEVFNYMSKAETFHGKPWFQADAKHGTTGPINTEPHDLAPISELLMKSYESRGMPYDPDMFTTGESPQGCGHVPRTVWQGNRTTSADYITKSRRRDNITIKTNTLVDKIILELLESSPAFQAVGVKTVSADGTTTIVRARKEVIISGGAYCSPAILLRSGIGAKDEVERFGITSAIDLPGVGQNLMDHLIVFLFYETGNSGLTTDHLIYQEGAASKAYELWKTQKSGFLSTFPFGAFAFTRLDDRLAESSLWKAAARAPGHDPMGQTPNQPHIEFFSTECYGGPPHVYTRLPLDHSSVFSLITQLFSPRSKGTVTLKSADPGENPVVDHNYLDDPLDLLVLSEGCRLANEVVTEGSGTKDIVKGSWPPEMAAHHLYTTREEWDAFVKDNALTCYHPAGTCSMGQPENPLAVVDPQLRVRGTTNLRVADVSIMPKLHSGHTQMPAYAIGEKAADLIKASAAAGA